MPFKTEWPCGNTSGQQKNSENVNFYLRVLNGLTTIDNKLCAKNWKIHF